MSITNIETKTYQRSFLECLFRSLIMLPITNPDHITYKRTILFWYSSIFFIHLLILSYTHIYSFGKIFIQSAPKELIMILVSIASIYIFVIFIINVLISVLIYWFIKMNFFYIYRVVCYSMTWLYIVCAPRAYKEMLLPFENYTRTMALVIALINLYVNYRNREKVFRFEEFENIVSNY